MSEKLKNNKLINDILIRLYIILHTQKNHYTYINFFCFYNKINIINCQLFC